MKSAMPIETGTAMRRARATDQTVPKTRGATYDQNGWPLRIAMSSGSSVRAGTLSTMRKAATAARIARMREPAVSAVDEKILSPRRCFDLRRGAVADVVIGSWPPAGWWCRCGAGTWTQSHPQSARCPLLAQHEGHRA